MIILALIVLLAILAAMFTAGFLAGAEWQRKRTVRWPSYTQVVAPTAELNNAHEQIRLMELRFQLVTTMQVVPASTFNVLPFQVVPSRAEITARTVLADELMLAWDRIAALEVEADYWYGLKTKHWNALKRLRARVRGMVPAEIAESKADGFTRSLTVAKSAFGRAADLSTASTELDVARAESQSLEEFNTEFEQILERHQIGVIA